MMSAIAPIWDGNETWLVVTGVVLWGAFPIVYATLLSAFYLPLILMLAGLILRGVAFEFRHQTERWRWLWDVSFAGGSLVAAFMQGLTVGALVEGLPIANGHYVGGDLGWLSPFALLCGVGSASATRCSAHAGSFANATATSATSAYRLIPVLSLALLLFLIAVFGFALVENLRVMNRWLERPYLFVFPAIGVAAVSSWRRACSGVATPRHSASSPSSSPPPSARSRFSFWPYMIPFSITIEQAAAPHSSLAFMFWGAGLFVFPLMLLYTATNYSVFRGRIRPDADQYH